jgi:myosin heavy subunit
MSLALEATQRLAEEAAARAAQAEDDARRLAAELQQETQRADQLTVEEAQWQSERAQMQAQWQGEQARMESQWHAEVAQLESRFASEKAQAADAWHRERVQLEARVSTLQSQAEAAATALAATSARLATAESALANASKDLSESVAEKEELEEESHSLAQRLESTLEELSNATATGHRALQECMAATTVIEDLRARLEAAEAAVKAADKRAEASRGERDRMQLALDEARLAALEAAEEDTKANESALAMLQADLAKADAQAAEQAERARTLEAELAQARAQAAAAEFVHSEAMAALAAQVTASESARQREAAASASAQEAVAVLVTRIAELEQAAPQAAPGLATATAIAPALESVPASEAAFASAMGEEAGLHPSSAPDSSSSASQAAASASSYFVPSRFREQRVVFSPGLLSPPKMLLMPHAAAADGETGYERLSPRRRKQGHGQQADTSTRSTGLFGHFVEKYDAISGRLAALASQAASPGGASTGERSGPSPRRSDQMSSAHDSGMGSFGGAAVDSSSLLLGPSVEDATRLSASPQGRSHGAPGVDDASRDGADSNVSPLRLHMLQQQQQQQQHLQQAMVERALFSQQQRTELLEQRDTAISLAHSFAGQVRVMAVALQLLYAVVEKQGLPGIEVLNTVVQKALAPSMTPEPWGKLPLMAAAASGAADEGSAPAAKESDADGQAAQSSEWDISPPTAATAAAGAAYAAAGAIAGAITDFMDPTGDVLFSHTDGRLSVAELEGAQLRYAAARSDCRRLAADAATRVQQYELVTEQCLQLAQRLTEVSEQLERVATEKTEALVQAEALSTQLRTAKAELDAERSVRSQTIAEANESKTAREIDLQRYGEMAAQFEELVHQRDSLAQSLTQLVKESEGLRVDITSSMRLERAKIEAELGRWKRAFPHSEPPEIAAEVSRARERLPMLEARAAELSDALAGAVAERDIFAAEAAKLPAAHAELDALRTAKTEMIEQIEAMGKKISELVDRCRALLQDRAALKEDLTRKTQDLDENRQRTDALLKVLKDAQQKADHAVAEAESQMTHASQRVTTAAAEVSELKDENSVLRKMLEEAQTMGAELQLELKAAREYNMNAHEHERKKVEAELSFLRMKLASADVDAARSMRRLGSTAAGATPASSHHPDASFADRSLSSPANGSVPGQSTIIALADHQADHPSFLLAGSDSILAAHPAAINAIRSLKAQLDSAYTLLEHERSKVASLSDENAQLNAELGQVTEAALHALDNEGIGE